MTTDQKVTGLNPVGVTLKSRGYDQKSQPLNFCVQTICKQLSKLYGSEIGRASCRERV